MKRRPLPLTKQEEEKPRAGEKGNQLRRKDLRKGVRVWWKGREGEGGGGVGVGRLRVEEEDGDKRVR